MPGLAAVAQRRTGDPRACLLVAPPHANGPRLRMFRELFWDAYATSPDGDSGPSWRHAMEKLGYTEAAGWCYVE